MKLFYQPKFPNLFLVIIGFLSSLLIGCSLFPVFITSDVPIFQISGWKSHADSYGIILRLDDTMNREGLLVKSTDSTQNQGIYRYSFKTNSLALVDDEIWEQSNGVIVGCSKADHVLKGKEHRVDGEHQISAAGEYFMLALINSNKTKAALLSVDGPERFILTFPFFIIGGITWMEGQQYHQFFSLNSDKPIGEPLRLPFQQKSPYYDWTIMCWSPDEKYVIYSDSDFRLVIIPVPSAE